MKTETFETIEHICVYVCSEAAFATVLYCFAITGVPIAIKIGLGITIVALMAFITMQFYKAIKE